MTAPFAFSAVVLAAGLSTRMGGPHKLLLDFGGEPVLRRVVSALLALGPAEVVVVTGHRAAEIGAALGGLPLRLVHNPDYAAGQAGSVATGMRALAAPCAAVMIMLGDQPLLTPAALARLLAAYGAMPADRSMLVPLYQGTRGNPVMVAARHIPAIATGALRLGCRKLIEMYPEEVALVEMADPAFIRDCDTPEDYAALRAHLGRAAEGLA
ncbi:nucleotidyltransferase family protein [Acidisoma sp. C75]